MNFKIKVKMFASKSLLKKIFEESIALSKIHGVSNIKRNEHWPIKIAWILIVLASTGLCSYFVIENLISYLEFGVITKMTFIKESTSQFPTISICNSNPFTTNNSSIYVKNLLSQNEFSQFLNYTDANLPIEPNKFVARYYTFINAYNLTNDVQKSLGLSIDQMLISCLYMGNNCTSSDFEWYYDLINGNCFRYNTGGLNTTLKNISVKGKRKGLKLEMFVGSANDVEINHPSTGVRIFIHKNSIKPVVGEGLDVATGKETNIAVGRTIFKKLSYPYSDCVSESNSFYYRTQIRLNGNYSFRGCIDYCFQENLIKACGCQDPKGSIIDNDVRVCSALSDLNGCAFNYYTLFYSGNLQETCSYCKYECRTVFYEFSSSFNSYPSVNYGQFLLRLNKIKSNNITSFKKLKRNVLSLNIFYDELKYTLIEEVPSIDLFTLFSGIGGIMGLFLGMSFINFFEIVELFIEILFFKIELYNKEKKSNILNGYK